MNLQILARLAPALLVAAAGGLATGLASSQTLNVVTAGDQNMVDYVNNFLGPRFEKLNPGVSVKAVGTGPGDAGSQKIYEKLSAQSKAGNAAWDIDVAVIHQRGAATMVKENLLAAYRSQIATDKLVTRDTARNALGQNVSGYVIPMFHSQIALAYNPDLVKAPPKNFTELEAWVRTNPKQFGYNGVKGGMSGVGFVIGYVSATSGLGKTLEEGPYDAGTKVAIDKSLAGLKEFNKFIVFTPGNAGTLDMLNRGEIGMGPVWVDMFQSWKAEGRLPPNMKLKILSPGMPGQPYYYAIPAKAKNVELAKKFIALATSPEVQAEGIVKRFNWYPGIDANVVKPALDPKIWNSLFVDVTPADLAKNGKPFPLAPFFTDLREQYEAQVQN